MREYGPHVSNWLLLTSDQILPFKNTSEFHKKYTYYKTIKRMLRFQSQGLKLGNDRIKVVMGSVG